VNLQLDHFPISKYLKKILYGPLPPGLHEGEVLKNGSTTNPNGVATLSERGEVCAPRRFTEDLFGFSVDDGLHNVSRWMTWLPISLKNAAKCDKWYQLQNHPITESLNAKGAREKLSQVNPVHAISLSVEQTSNRRRPLPSNGARYFDHKSLGSARTRTSRKSGARTRSPGGCPDESPLVICLKWATTTQHTNNEHANYASLTLVPFDTAHCFVHRPECGRTTRRT
jgi:hypothetical protein